MISANIFQLNAALIKFDSFRKKIHTFSKHLMLEEGDGGHFMCPVTTSRTSSTAATSISDSPLYKHKLNGQIHLVVRQYKNLDLIHPMNFIIQSCVFSVVRMQGFIVFVVSTKISRSK